MNNQINEAECYVAFIDILGFSDFVLNHHSNDILGIFENIEMCKREILSDKCAWEDSYNDLANNTAIYVMSDSIVIAIPENISGALYFLVKWCAEIQRRLLLKNELLSRGGIASGSYFQNEKIAFGSAFVKAHILETIAVTPRIILSKELGESVSGTTMDNGICCVDYFDGYYLNDDEFRKICKIIKNNIGKEKLRIKYMWLKQRIIDSNDKYTALIEQSNIDYADLVGNINSDL